MKRIILVIFPFVLVLACCSLIALQVQTKTSIPAGDYTYDIYELTFSTKQISNGSFGEDWSFTYTHNGQTIQNRYKITQSVEIFTFQPIGVEVRKNNEPNVIGKGTLKVALCDGGSGKTTITITETDGKGNAAVWEITCKVKLIGKK